MYRDTEQRARVCQTLLALVGLESLWAAGQPSVSDLARLDPAKERAVGTLIAARADGVEAIDSWIEQHRAAAIHLGVG